MDGCTFDEYFQLTDQLQGALKNRVFYISIEILLP